MDLPLNAMTPRVRGTLVEAAHQAKLAGHRHIGTEHLLLALALDGDGIAGNVLTELGVRDAVRERLAHLLATLTSGGGQAGNPEDEALVDLVPEGRSNHPLRVLERPTS